ncbi:MAG: hypothetical protein CMI16_12800 [Opitutaceae bacterium]|nr:hypothetical protein [Opitutaceae bacterium]
MRAAHDVLASPIDQKAPWQSHEQGTSGGAGGAAGGRAGDGGGMMTRGPQLLQSVPYSHTSYPAPGPPSSHVNVRPAVQVFEHTSGGGEAGGSGGGRGGGGGGGGGGDGGGVGGPGGGRRALSRSTSWISAAPPYATPPRTTMTKNAPANTL